MNILRRRACLVALCLLALTGTAQAQPATGLDPKELDARVYKTLRDVINLGADLYNKPSNDYNGCYRLYQGALMTLKPMLDHRPGLQKTIDSALAKAQGEGIAERGFTLRAAIDRIREETGGKEAAAKLTLWQRLGGEKNVRKVVDDFVGLAATDPKVDFFRDGKYKPNAEQVADLKQKIVEMISSTSGGPMKYTGKSMKEAHKGMGITEAQFNALAADLKKALEQNGAKADDVKAVLDVVGGTKKDIVEEPKEEKKEPKKDGEKKDGEKKDGEKKDGEKKDGEKKDGEKKDGEKKDGEKKDGGASVQGNITLNGKPLEGGTITLVDAKDATAKQISAEIKDGGGYQIQEVLPGKYRIKVVPPAMGKDAIPAAYQSEKTTPLVFQVQKGASNFDIDLREYVDINLRK